ALLAVMILGIFSLQMNRTIFSGEQKMILNEVAVQATGVGAELLEEIGAKPYAHGVAERAFSENDINSLPEKGDFCGACGCNPDANFNGCSFITDFDGATATRVRNDIEYNVDIEVN